MPELWAEHGFSSSKSRPPIAAGEQWGPNRQKTVAGVGVHADNVAPSYRHTTIINSHTSRQTKKRFPCTDPWGLVHTCRPHVALLCSFTHKTHSWECCSDGQDGNSGTFMTGGGQALTKEHRHWAWGIEPEPGRNKGIMGQRKSPKSSCFHRWAHPGFQPVVFSSNLCTIPCLNCWFPLLLFAVCPAPLLIHSQITTICRLKGAFWIQRQKMAAQQRVAGVLWGNVAKNV